jgi:hypothetical protein
MSMRAWTWGIAALLATATALAARPSADTACSTSRVYGVRAGLFMLATAGADTVRTGPGAIRYDARDAGPADLARIHGQRFRLDRLGGDVPAVLAGAEGGDAILVPYVLDCGERLRWTDGAIWAQPGGQVFTDAALRPREQWVDGIPTFDVEMMHGVYPEGYKRMMEDDSAALMTPQQAFELTGLLPTWDAAQAAPAPAYRPLVEWARANPDLAALFPATQALAWAADELQPCVPRYDPHPVAGTYRAFLVLERTDTLTFLFQTDGAGSAVCAPVQPRLDVAEVRPVPADTARLYVRGGADMAILEATPPGVGAHCGGGSVEVVNQPREEAAGRSWEAEYNYLVLPLCFLSDPRVGTATEAVFAASMADEPNDDGPGRFIEAKDGVRFEQRWSAGGRVLLEMRATRVSTDVRELH